MKLWVEEEEKFVCKRVIKCIATPLYIVFIPEFSIAVANLSKLHLMSTSFERDQTESFRDALKEKCDGLVHLWTLDIDGTWNFTKFVTLELQGHLSLWSIDPKTLIITKHFFVELHFVCSDLIEV